MAKKSDNEIAAEKKQPIKQQKASDIAKNEAKAKKQAKVANRIAKLEKMCTQHADEQQELNEKLCKYEEQIKYFEDRFKRIYDATGLAETGKIINKFFVNKEINNEQSKLLEDLYAKLDATQKEAAALETQLKVLHNNNNDHTWREIDGLQESLQKAKSNLVAEKSQTEKINLEFTLFAEWMSVIQNNFVRKLNANYKIEDKLKAIKQQRGETPKDLVDSLAEYIQLMQDIIANPQLFERKEQKQVIDDMMDDEQMPINKLKTTKKIKQNKYAAKR